jgi:hypothetical protein
MDNNEVYKNRDLMLGDIHSTVKKLDAWCDKHEEKDNKRFLFTWVVIVIVAACAGVIPQLAAFALEHFK